MVSAVESIRKKTGSARWLGVLLIVLGVLALVAPLAAGLSVTMVIGSLLLVSGVAQLSIALRGGSVGEAVWLALPGLLALLCGGYMLFQPAAALGALTLLLASLFFVQGVIEVSSGFGSRPDRGWGWLLASGVVSVLLAVAIWRQFPISGLWAVGTLVGARLLMSGISILAIGSVVRDVTSRVGDQSDA